MSDVTISNILLSNGSSFISDPN